jgi:hypothetical protein
VRLCIEQHDRASLPPSLHLTSALRQSPWGHAAVQINVCPGTKSPAEVLDPNPAAPLPPCQRWRRCRRLVLALAAQYQINALICKKTSTALNEIILDKIVNVFRGCSSHCTPARNGPAVSTHGHCCCRNCRARRRANNGKCIG